MRYRRYVREDSYIFKDKEPGDVWVCGEYKSNKVAFIYADENNTLKTYCSNPKTVNTLYNFPVSKCVKLGIKKDKFDNYFNTMRLDCNAFGHCDWNKDSNILEINGKELHLYDYVKVYINKTDYFDKEIGILISNNRCLFKDGSSKKVRCCQKVTEKDMEYYQSDCKILKQLCLSLMNQGLKKVNDTYSIGDIYKKGENIYIYLGDCYIVSEIFPIRKNEGLYYKLNFNLPKEYTDGGPLWLKTKLSDNYHLRKIVMNFLENKEQDVNFDKNQLLIIFALSISGLKIENKVDGFYVNNYECFKYNVRPSLLGDYIGHIRIKSDFFNSNYFYFTNRRSGSQVLQNAKSNLKIKIRKVQYET